MINTVLNTFQKAKKTDKYFKYGILFLAFYFLFSCSKDPALIPAIPVISPHSLKIDVFIKNLQIPWGMAFLPNGDFIFNERPGKINLLKKDATTQNTIMFRAVNSTGEGGLLGIAIDPDFNTSHFIFIYETTDSNRVVRLKMENDALTQDKIIVRDIVQAGNHNGGVLQFGPDGYLYIGTGDATVPSSAQNKNSLSGKILRVDKNGNPAPGNPFNNRVWSYGHRNVQGFSWTKDNKMLATEHGPSGEFNWCCHDEINLIEPGKNYGWPLALGGTETDSLTPPLIQSGSDTWAPSGCIFIKNGPIWQNTLLVGALRGQRIIRFTPDQSDTQIISKADTLQDQFNRIRNIVQAPDGSILFCTSNLGSINPPTPGDDKIYRLYIK